MKSLIQNNIEKIANFIIFNGSWWAIILLAINKPTGYVFFLFALFLINYFFHFQFNLEKSRKKAELIFLLSAFIIGIATELFLMNIYAYRYTLIPSYDFKIPPPWIFCIWTIFPISIGQSLSFLYKLRLPGMLLGAALTTFTYSVGEGFDLLYFTEPKLESMAYFCGVWFALLAFLFKFRETIHKKF